MQEFDTELSHFLQIQTPVSGCKATYIKGCSVVQHGLINSGPVGKHLFVIVLDTNKVGNQHQIVSVPVCTARDYARVDDSCLIGPGEHPFVKADSFIQYRDTRVDPVGHLQKCVQEGTFTPHTPASQELVDKIKAGLSGSKFVKRHIKDLLGC